MTEDELSEQRGSATEANWDEFVSQVGGYKVSDRFPRAEFENADYVFPVHKVIVELKIIENEIDKILQFSRIMRTVKRRPQNSCVVVSWSDYIMVREVYTCVD